MEASVRLSVTVDPPDLAALGDPERIHQVVANLLENAVRHSPAGGLVAASAGRCDTHARITIVDEGPGIPGAEAARVFERFYRADAARSSGDGGTGLGLSISRWIVELHGGDIQVEDREPHGCRMVIHLPPSPA